MKNLVLVPGLLCDPQLWAPQVAGLAKHANTWVADVTRDDSVAGMAKRVLTEAPFQSFALAGLSMGGYVSMEIMRQAPQRVERLALLDTGARADTPEQTTRRQGLLELANTGKFIGVPDRLLPLFLGPRAQQDARLVAIVKSMAANVGKDAFVRQQQAIMGRPDSRDSLKKIACRTLVLCGEQDALTPPALHEEIAALIGGARLVLIPDSGHLSTLEAPAAVNRALEEWLAS